MKKIALGIGIALIVLLAGVWVYLLFFSTSTANNDLFSLFNFGDSTDTTISLEELSDIPDEQPLVDISSPEPLRQLTTRPTIGHQEVQLNASSTPLVYFSEAGTGHIYSIDLVSGVESRVSNITVPGASKADISSDGRFAVIQSGAGSPSGLTVLSLPSAGSELSSHTISEEVSTFSLTSDRELLYSVQTNSGTIGKVYNLTSLTVRTLFQIPLRDMVVDWGDTAESKQYVFPKPAADLQGFLYEIVGNSLNRLPASGFGFSSKSNNDYSLYTLHEEGESLTYIQNHPSNSNNPLYTNILPEKCALSTKELGVAVCGYHSDVEGSKMPDVWYSGETSFKDKILFIYLKEPQLTQLVDTYTQTGRELDIVNPTLNEDSSRLLFNNKNDRTLWLYEINKPDVIEF